MAGLGRGYERGGRSYRPVGNADVRRFLSARVKDHRGVMRE